MMSRPLAALLLLALACCANQQDSAAQDASPQARCDRQARNDPKVKEIRMRQVSNPYLNVTLKPELDRTIRSATQQCLLSLGIGVPGGVVPITTR
jgi:hypothetical protein